MTLHHLGANREIRLGDQVKKGGGSTSCRFCLIALTDQSMRHQLGCDGSNRDLSEARGSGDLCSADRPLPANELKDQGSIDGSYQLTIGRILHVTYFTHLMKNASSGWRRVASPPGLFQN
jgi:hypothetical protein